jgi:hypothetical protein
MSIPIIVQGSVFLDFVNINLQRYARVHSSRSADPLVDAGNLYTFCGKVNELLRNKKYITSFAVVLIGFPVEDKQLTIDHLRDLQTILFVCKHNQLISLVMYDSETLILDASVPDQTVASVKTALDKAGYVIADVRSSDALKPSIDNVNQPARCAYTVAVIAQATLQGTSLDAALNSVPAPDAHAAAPDGSFISLDSIMSRLVLDAQTEENGNEQPPDAAAALPADCRFNSECTLFI